jgi:hypothetical protein
LDCPPVDVKLYLVKARVRVAWEVILQIAIVIRCPLDVERVRKQTPDLHTGVKQ